MTGRIAIAVMVGVGGAVAVVGSWQGASALSSAQAVTVQPSSAKPVVPAVAPGGLRVLVDDNYPPYIYRDDQGGVQGIIPDLWALWSVRTGIPVELIATDWEEAQNRFNAGEGEVLDTVFRTEAREALYDFSAPYATIDVSIVFDSSLSGIRDAQTLRGFAVGVKAGDACIDVLGRQGIDSMRPYPSYEALVRAAGRNEIKVACIDQPPALYYLIRQGLLDRFRTSPPLYTGQFHWVVRKGEHALFDTVAQGFSEISADERSQINHRWLGMPMGAIFDIWSLREIVSVLLLIAGAGGVLIVSVAILRRQVRARTRDLTQAMMGLRNSEKRFRTIFDAVNEAIFIHDLKTGAIHLVNRRAAELFGFRVEEIRTLTIEDLSLGTAPYDMAAAMARIREAAMQPQQFEWWCRHRDGHPFWVEVDLRRVEIDAGDPIILAVMRDISERKEAEDKLTRTIDALTRSNTDLERFAYAASHDLREPLNTLVRYAQLLESRYGGRMDPDAREFVGFIVGAARQMMRLVEGLLEFSRVDAIGRGFDAVESSHALSVALGYLSNAIAESGATVRVGEMPVVAADEVQLIQLFQNLIGNALKYRDRSRPAEIAVSCRRSGALWEFLVADNGIGIDAAYLDQIFIIFKRLHTHSTIPGVGIGLALCRRIVERHGGTIWAESEPGRGTVFHFTLSPPSDSDVTPDLAFPPGESI